MVPGAHELMMVSAPVLVLSSLSSHRGTWELSHGVPLNIVVEFYSLFWILPAANVVSLKQELCGHLSLYR